jgi:hypothetical protein
VRENLPFHVLEVQTCALELAKLLEPHTFCQYTVSISLSPTLVVVVDAHAHILEEEEEIEGEEMLA